MEFSDILPRAVFLSVLAAFGLTGCKSLGPQDIESKRTEFNEAIQRTDLQQVLLNIVRQRFSDPVMFLEITAISSSMTRTSNANLGAMLTSLGPNTSSGGIGGALTESPMIFYAPNSGERFVRQILTPVDLKTISLLLQSGWSVERVLLIAVESIGDLNNTTAPHVEFASVARQLRVLQRKNLLAFAVERDDTNGDRLLIIPKLGAHNEAAYLDVCRLLNQKPDGNPIRLQLGIGNSLAGLPATAIVTRSLYSSFYFLGNGVNLPARDLADRRGQERELAGTVFDPAQGPLFEVKNSHDEPKSAAVKIKYRNNWYFIQESDQDSRTTLALISMLLMLQSGDVSRITPLVSLSPR